MKKLTAAAIALTMLLSFSACNSDSGSPGTDAPGTNAKVKTNYKAVVPSEEDFDYLYDAALKGAVITKYKGVDEAVRIPAEIDGDKVAAVKEYAFDGSSVKCIEVPDGINLDRYALSSPALEKAVLPKDMEEIPTGLFSGCQKLRDVNIPKNCTHIGTRAFENCCELKAVEIPKGCTYIGGAAFENCRELTKLTIPDTLEAVNKRAFAGCISLTSIDLPDSLVYKTEDGDEINKIADELFMGCEALKEIKIPDNITLIGEGAFYGCTSLEKAAMPDAVTYIEANAFCGCTSLKDINISNSVTEIESKAFENCTKLRSMTLPDSLKHVSRDIFDGCSGLTVTYKDAEYDYRSWAALYNQINGEKIYSFRV